MVHKHPGFDRRTEFSPDGRWLASEDGEGVMVWAVESGDPVMPPLFVGGYGPSLEFSPDGRTLLLPGFLQTRLWDLRPEERSVEDIRVVSQLLAARRLDNGKAIGPSDPGSMPDLLARVRSSEKNQRRHDISFYPSIETALLWHQQQAAICHRITYFTAALYHLNVLVEAFGSRPDYRMQRGDVHAFLDQFDRAVADYTRASELKTDDRRVWFNRGYCFAQQSKWKDAEADFSRAVTTQTEEVRAAYFHALTLLAMDQIDAYQIACTKAQTKYGADLPSDIAWMCLLHPEGNPDLASLVKLLQERLDKRSSQLLQLCLGAAYYRHGEFAEAVKRLRQSIEVQKRDETTEPTVYSESLGEDKLADAWLFLVMAHKRLGQDQDAQQWLGKAAPVVARLCPENAQDLARNESQAFLPWNQRLELRLLYAEAKSLIENKSASSSTSNDKQE
jgi:tetratricopeptide (TPR) repeat protein